MGIGKQLRQMSKEYLKDPKGQFFRQVNAVLDLGKKSGVSNPEIIKHLESWIKDHSK